MTPSADIFAVSLATAGAAGARGALHPVRQRKLRRWDRGFCFHYVTARKTHDLVNASEAAWEGPIDQARDFKILPPPCHSADPAKVAQSDFCSQSLRTTQIEPMETVDATDLCGRICRD